jgi:hypothetical protein
MRREFKSREGVADSKTKKCVYELPRSDKALLTANPSNFEGFAAIADSRNMSLHTNA